MKITIGEAFRIAMKRKNLKQTDLAKKLNLDRRSVNQALKNYDENKGGIKTLFEYAEALGIEINFEFKDKEFEEN